MQRGNISSEMAALVAIDFDTLVKAPEPVWWLRAYEWCGSKKWLRRPYLWLLPLYIRRHSLTREADTAGWWLVEKGLRIKVVVRLPYTPGLASAVEKVLGDYPNDFGGFHLVPSETAAEQAMDIQQHCRGERVLRFYTRDKALLRFLPSSLGCFVDTWDESILY